MTDELVSLLRGRKLPQYIAIEGPIGVGKTTLAKRIAQTFQYQTILENPGENPFLEQFYQDMRRHALATQLSFLFQRTQTIQDLRQGDIFSPRHVADFMLQKDPLFARLTLNSEEYELYNKVYDQMTLDIPTPDLVIYLQAPTDVLLRRIHKRGISAENKISANYLKELNQIYSEFFLYYEDSPLLIVNASDIDLATSDADYHNLVNYFLDIRSGRHYFNPTFFG
jgi:deoxyadenosine/deoxycytidine kinase